MIEEVWAQMLPVTFASAAEFWYLLNEQPGFLRLAASMRGCA